MKRINKLVSIFCVLIILFMFSACASFNSVRETDEFLAAEKAKGIAPKTEVVTKSIPRDVAVSSGLAKAGSVDSLWWVAGVAGTISGVGGAVLAAPLIVGGLVAKGAAAAVRGAEIASTTEVDMTQQFIATTDFGRFAEHTRTKYERDANGKIIYVPRDAKGNRIKLPTIFDAAIKEAAPLPAQCEIIGQYFNYADFGNSNFKYSSDKENNIDIGFAKKFKYGLAYATVRPENPVQGQTPAICTKAIAEEHFNKIIKIMESH